MKFLLVVIMAMCSNILWSSEFYMPGSSGGIFLVQDKNIYQYENGAFKKLGIDIKFIKNTNSNLYYLKWNGELYGKIGINGEISVGDDNFISKEYKRIAGNVKSFYVNGILPTSEAYITVIDNSDTLYGCNLPGTKRDYHVKEYMKNVIFISQGLKHLLCIDKNNRLYSIGNNYSYGSQDNAELTGRTGLTEGETAVFKPVLDDVLWAYAGSWYSLAVKKNGDLYFTGIFGDLKSSVFKKIDYKKEWTDVYLEITDSSKQFMFNGNEYISIKDAEKHIHLSGGTLYFNYWKQSKIAPYSQIDSIRKYIICIDDLYFLTNKNELFKINLNVTGSEAVKVADFIDNFIILKKNAMLLEKQGKIYLSDYGVLSEIVIKD